MFAAGINLSIDVLEYFEYVGFGKRFFTVLKQSAIYATYVPKWVMGWRNFLA